MSSLLELISIHELLRDRQYREYFLKPPTLPDHYANAKPWKLLLLKQGETAWRFKRFNSYRDAFGMLKENLPLIINGAINCPPAGLHAPDQELQGQGQVRR